jgi:hypothetical protein
MLDMLPHCLLLSHYTHGHTDDIQTMETWNGLNLLIRERKFDKLVQELELLNTKQKLFCDEEEYTQWKANLISHLKTLSYPQFENLSQREEFFLCLLKCFQILNDVTAELACKFELMSQHPKVTIENWIALGDECYLNVNIQMKNFMIDDKNLNDIEDYGY